MAPFGLAHTERTRVISTTCVDLPFAGRSQVVATLHEVTRTPERLDISLLKQLRDLALIFHYFLYLRKIN